jgi:hypothetical protein
VAAGGKYEARTSGYAFAGGSYESRAGSGMKLCLRDDDGCVSTGCSRVGRGGYTPSGLYHGPKAVLADCNSRFMVCTKHSSLSTLDFRMSFVSVRVDRRALFRMKNSLIDSYGQDGRWAEVRVWRGPVHGHPFELCRQGITRSGQVAAWAVKVDLGNTEPQAGQLASFSGHTAWWF